MITTVISDFSRVILQPIDANHEGGLNALHKELIQQLGTYDLWEYFVINEELLSFYSSLKPTVSINIFTKGTIQKEPQIKEKITPIFENIFSATELNLSKKDPESYKLIAKKLNVQPEEILYVDDQQGNIDAAKQAGMNVILFTSTKQILKEIHEIINM